MPVCKQIKRKHRKICIGDLDEIIVLKTRSTGFNDCDPTPTFVTHSEPWALLETVSGESVFDDTNTEVEVTDVAYITFDATVTRELFAEFNGDNYRILTVEDLDRRNEWMKLKMTSRGVTSKAVNDA
jgi:SPP1 family predicted phage head-tail adaptor